MDIQKEREAFEAYFKDKYPELHKDVFDENGDDRAIIGYSFALSAWQAAKAQVVPECTWSRNEDYCFDTSCGNNFMFTECEDKPSTHQFKHCCYCGGKLIEAQEQSHD